MALDLIETYLAHLRESGCTDDTIKTYGWILGKAHQALPCGLDVACDEELRTWLWRDGLKQSSRATYYGALNGFFGYHCDSGELDWNPMADIRRPKVPRGVPRVGKDAEVQLVLTQAAEPYRLWAKLAAYEGLRCVEIERLDREHITETTTMVHLGKGNKIRRLPTHRVVWCAVKDLPPGPITDFDREDISNRFKKACVRLGVPGLSMHRIRGWYCTTGYRASKDLRAMQKAMGHANPATTVGYIDIPDDDVAAALSGLPTFGLTD